MVVIVLCRFNKLINNKITLDNKTWNSVIKKFNKLSYNRTKVLHMPQHSYPEMFLLRKVSYCKLLQFAAVFSYSVNFKSAIYRVQ